MLNVFLVDDNDTFREVFQINITLEGYSIITNSTNGIEAARTFNNGIEAIKEILKILEFSPKEILKMDPNIKIIIMSSEKSSFSVGAVCIYEKVFPFKIFLNRINDVLLNF